MARKAAALLAALCLAIAASAQTRPQQPVKRRITNAEIKLVIQEVEQEIKDYGYQDEYADMDAPPAEGPKAGILVRIYINPEILADGTGGEVIYKLMPYGEVFREFEILPSGRANLDGDPDNEFPPGDESATQTVYMDEDRVLRMKKAWLRRYFSVYESPNEGVLSHAKWRSGQRRPLSHLQATKAAHITHAK